MKKHHSLSSNKLLFSKERVTRLSADDLDNIIGGFQVEAHEYAPASLAIRNLCPPLDGHLPLTQYNPGLHP